LTCNCGRRPDPIYTTSCAAIGSGSQAVLTVGRRAARASSAPSQAQQKNQRRCVRHLSKDQPRFDEAAVDRSRERPREVRLATRGRTAGRAAALVRTLLNTFPTWVLGLFGVGGTACLAAVGLAVFRKRLPKLIQVDTNDVAGVAIGVIAAIYGITLGFVIVVLYEEFNSAQSNVQAESGQLVQLYQDTSGMPIASALETQMRGYVADVRFREFPKMRAGHSYGTFGDQRVTNMYDILRGYVPRTANQVEFYDDAVSHLDGVVAARLTRLDQASEQLPAPFAVLLLIGDILVIGSLYLLHVPDRRVHLALILGVSILTSFTLLTAIALDHPFSGDVSVSSESFSQGKLSALNATPRDEYGP
jgi:hypothetical protein